jgi:polysaccharide pyruvyl transferase WcaK-like protein
MEKCNNNFLLVGNGPYHNRGCEAIVRGTMEILRREFGPDIHAEAGVYASDEVVASQNIHELDPAIHSFPIMGMGPRLSRKWWASQANRRLGCRFSPQCWDWQPLLKTTAVALEVGGDNYSLDYGKPDGFLDMDRFIQRRGIPIVLWGASVGPFDDAPEFAARIFTHLSSLFAIFVRETESLEYLRAHGVSRNVHLVADPAFLMEPLAVPREKLGFPLPAEAIGINLSPLISRFRQHEQTLQSGGDRGWEEWAQTCVAVVEAVGKQSDRPVLLVPHVSSDSPANDDWQLLEAVCKKLAGRLKHGIFIVPRGLNAQELKWAIAHCSVFIGARTHSTIAALSSGIPTLSIGYSMKARGINHDLFGHQDYCLGVNEFSPSNVVTRLQRLLQLNAEIRAHLQAVIPTFRSRARAAGLLLKNLLSKHHAGFHSHPLS